MAAPFDHSILRMLDANANRAREALRVLEDVARFALNDAPLSEDLKRLRHDLAAALATLPMDQAMLARDTPRDVGTSISTPAEGQRKSLAAIATAAGKRLSEALRSIEECAKTFDAHSAKTIEQLRYRGYTLEQSLARIAVLHPATERFARVRLYVLLTDALCHPEAGGWERVLEALLSAVPSDGSVAIQLREKDLADAELLRRAKLFAARCGQAGVISILNDRPDIALLSRADGVHVGQDDLPAAEIRRIVGPNAIVGVSTERLEQAREAVRAGAAYIGVGPMFATTTKHKPRLAGPAYAAHAAAEIPLPIVPIGGITLENFHELQIHGIHRAAVCAAIIAQPDPAAAMTAFLERLGR
ncbi:MAG TPA: thiamine phosphate synthase [Phycisphaerae bacterium]|nr:thiamine phosphate synthase [Phycisphaerae bacterium]